MRDTWGKLFSAREKKIEPTPSETLAVHMGSRNPTALPARVANQKPVMAFILDLNLFALVTCQLLC